MLKKQGPSLNAGIGQGADLLAIKSSPLLAAKMLVEPRDSPGVQEIDKRVAHIALVLLIPYLEIDREVDKVKSCLLYTSPSPRDS